jgi:hypothetical protein
VDAAGPVDAENAPTGPWITADGYPRAPTAIIGYRRVQARTSVNHRGGPNFGITGGPDFVDKSNCADRGYKPLDERQFGKEVVRAYREVKRERASKDADGVRRWRYIGLTWVETTDR